MNRARTSATALFEELGFPDSLDLAVKVEAVLLIKTKMEEMKLTQAALARQIGWRPSRLSDLLRGRLDLFSFDKINEVLKPFGAAIENHPKLRLPHKPRSRAKVAA